jgi:DNA-binding protein
MADQSESNKMTDKEQTENEEASAKEAEAEESPKKEVEKKEAPPRGTKPQNVVYVGNKPPMTYVMAVITAFNFADTNNVIMKARGRAISTAVDVAEIIRNRFFKDAKVHTLSIGTEQITPREGGNPRNVSTIEINLKK